MARRGYPLRVLHEYRFDPEALKGTLAVLTGSDDMDALRTDAGVSRERMALVPVAAEVLLGVLRVLRPDEIYVSSYGMREGLLFEQMPDQLRDRDPLIEACLWAEDHDARVPGFGRVLYHFVRPLFAGAAPERLRLVRAACLLHDVSWRAHPDYRAQVCFDYATRANLGGLSHEDRVFLGLALLHRYKNSRPDSVHEAMIGLLGEDGQHAAQILGKSMRFGAMFTAQAREDMGALTWDAATRQLTLSIGPRAMALYGEVAQARFASLARTLGAESEVVSLSRAS